MLPLTQFAAEEEVEGIAQLGLDPLQIALQAGTFLLLYIILRRYALDKIVRILDDRRQKIEESLANADQIENELAKTEETSQKTMTEARAKADEIIANGNVEAGAIVEAAEEKAAKRAEEIVAAGHNEADQALLNARAELKQELTGLVSEATEAIIGEKVDDAKDHQIINNALKQGVDS